MRSRSKTFLTTVATTAFGLALAAPEAFGRITGGEGFYGPTTDKVVTEFGFAIIFGIPALLVILSIIQRRSENREHEHLEAQHARADLAEWHGGW
jgi:hypothetical protein